MSDQLIDFADRTGQELFKLLAQRALDELSQESGFDRFSAILAASIIPVAEVLRDPIEKAQDAQGMADEMVDLASTSVARASRICDRQASPKRRLMRVRAASRGPHSTY
jgi:hypothetical protein